MEEEDVDIYRRPCPIQGKVYVRLSGCPFGVHPHEVLRLVRRRAGLVVNHNDIHIMSGPCTRKPYSGIIYLAMADRNLAEIARRSLHMEEFHDRFMKTQPATWEQVLVEFQNQRQRRRKQRWESHIPPPPEENICSDDHIAMVHFISPTSNTAALKCFLGTAAVERLTPSTAAAGFRSKEERSNASRLSNLIRFGGEFVRIVPITYRQFLEQEEDTEEHSHAPDEGQNQEDQQQPNNRGGQEQQEPTNQEQNQEHEEDIAIVYESRGSPKNRIRRIKEIIAKDDVHSEEEEELETFFKCGICFCHPPSASQVVCCTSGHIYCSDCLHGWAAAQVPSPTTCPECRVSMAGEGGIVRLRVIEEFLKKMHVSKEQRKKQAADAKKYQEVLNLL